MEELDEGKEKEEVRLRWSCTIGVGLGKVVASMVVVQDMDGRWLTATFRVSIENETKSLCFGNA